MAKVAANGLGPKVVAVPQSAALLRTIMENAAVGMVLTGTDSRIIYSNRAHSDMFGYATEECIGLFIGDLVHPDDRQEENAQIQRLLNSDNEQYRVERRYVRRDGSSFWGLTSASLLRHEDASHPHSIVLQIMDIDGQKRAEAALAESESRWNFALEGAGQGVWDHNLRDRTAFFSATWRSMRGYGPHEEIDGSYEAWIKRVHPDDRARIADATQRQDSGELPYNKFEYRERHREGHWIWILSLGKPVEWFPDGRPARILGTDTDISSFKATEAALAEEREKLDVTLQSIADGVLCIDRQGKVTFLNPAAEQMIGWRSRDALNRPLDEVFRRRDETGAIVGGPFPFGCEEGLERQFCQNMTLVSRTGRTSDIRLSAARLSLPADQSFGAVLVFQDISESLALQRKLAHLASHDPLTGLHNRSAFESKLQELLAKSQAEGSRHVLGFVDLDRFKTINDSAGHAAGDALLQEVARTLQAKLRDSDFVARIGGDEFAIILSDCNLAQAKELATGLTTSIAHLRITHEGQSLSIGASVGLTSISRNSPSSGKLMEEADQACYAAKAAKDRNVVSIFDLQRPVAASTSLAPLPDVLAFWKRWSWPFRKKRRLRR